MYSCGPLAEMIAWSVEETERIFCSLNDMCMRLKWSFESHMKAEFIQSSFFIQFRHYHASYLLQMVAEAGMVFRRYMPMWIQGSVGSYSPPRRKYIINAAIQAVALRRSLYSANRLADLFPTDLPILFEFHKVCSLYLCLPFHSPHHCVYSRLLDVENGRCPLEFSMI